MSDKTQKLTLDDIDYDIVNLLQEDADRSGQIMSSELSKRGHNIKDAAINARIRNMIKSGYIKKKTISIDYSKFGAPNTHFLTTKITESTSEKIERLKNIVMACKDVFEFYEISGTIDYIIKVRTSTLGEATSLSKQISTSLGIEVTTSSVSEVFREDISMEVPRGRSRREESEKAGPVS